MMLQRWRAAVLHPRPSAFCQPSKPLVLGKLCRSAEPVTRDSATTGERNLGNSEGKDGLREGQRNKLSAPPTLALSSPLSYASALMPFLAHLFPADTGS